MLQIAELKAPPQVLAALESDGRWNGRWLRAYCPFCDDGRRKSRTLAASAQGFGMDRSKAGWLCFRCGCQEQFRQGQDLKVLRLQYDAEALKGDEARRQRMAADIFENTSGVSDGDFVDRYLLRRGLKKPGAFWPTCLRKAMLQHPRTKKRYPTMVAQVVDAHGMPLGIHRTFLTEDGRKADVVPNKMMLGPTAGGAVRLGVDSDEIIVAEGIETALAAAAELEGVAWASLSTSGMKRLELPRSVERIKIAPDRDSNGAGYAAAKSLRTRIKGMQTAQKRRIRVEIIHPPTGRSDFADFG